MAQYNNIFDFQSFPLTMGTDVYCNNLYFYAFMPCTALSMIMQMEKEQFMAHENMTTM
jgi:hypothetical protein